MGIFSSLKTTFSSTASKTISNVSSTAGSTLSSTSSFINSTLSSTGDQGPNCYSNASVLASFYTSIPGYISLGFYALTLLSGAYLCYSNSRKSTLTRNLNEPNVAPLLQNREAVRNQIESYEKKSNIAGYLLGFGILGSIVGTVVAGYTYNGPKVDPSCPGQDYDDGADFAVKARI